MPFIAFLFFGFMIYMKLEILFFPVLIIAIILIIFKYRAKKQNQSYLTKKPFKKAIHSSDSSLYQKAQNQTQKNNYYQQIRQKGDDGENAFQVFLETIEVPFTFVEQEPDTKYSGFKRPDFILGYKYKSNEFPIAFEVKNHQKYNL